MQDAASELTIVEPLTTHGPVLAYQPTRVARLEDEPGSLAHV